MKKAFVFAILLSILMPFSQLESVRADEAWKSAYYGFLKTSFENQEEFYEFALEDVNDNGIPELFIWDRGGLGSVIVYTYDGKMQELGRINYNFAYLIKYRFDSEIKYLMNAIVGARAYESYEYYEVSETPTEDWPILASTEYDYTSSTEIRVSTLNGQEVSDSDFDDFVSELRISEIEITKYPFNEEGITKSNLGVLTLKDSYTVKLDGKEMKFNVEPQNVDGHIYVEMRVLFENLGYTLQYDDKRNEIIAKKGSITFNISKYYHDSPYGKYVINYTNTESDDDFYMNMELQPKIIDSRTMLPLRIVGELTGYDINWNNNTKTASFEKINIKNGTRYVQIRSIGGNNEITVSNLYYEAGRQLESLNPVMINVDGFENSKIMTSVDDVWIYSPNNAYGLSHQYIKFGEFKSTFDPYTFYEIKIIDGKITYIQEVYMA